ncbi:MAG: hypothetical protein KAT70_04140, partial [Thermoplasmata archaeon]|nr:hypothetical protein [Thermoplasmata archaeon]
IMESGARGCQVTIAGKLTGQRHRTAKFKQGHIKFCGEPSLIFMDRGYSAAKLKPGVLGVTVWIMKSDARLPDEVEVADKFPSAGSDVKKAAVEEENEVKDTEVPDAVGPSPDVSPDTSADTPPDTSTKDTSADAPTKEAPMKEEAPEEKTKEVQEEKGKLEPTKEEAGEPPVTEEKEES